MKIYHFVQGRCNPDSANGVDKTVYYLSKAQGDLGHEVTVFSLTSKDSITIPNVRVENFPLEKWPFSISPKIVDYLHESPPDFVHLHSAYIPSFITLGKILNRKKIPYAITPNGVFSTRLLKRRWYIKWPFRYFLEIPLFNNAKFIHVVSEFEMTDLQQAGIESEFVVAPNGIDINQLNFNKSESNLLNERYPTIGNRRIFMFLGRLDIMQKGLDNLLEGFEILNRSLNNSVLVLVGPEWNGSLKILKEKVKLFGLQNSVIFTGPAYSSDKANYLSAADIFIHVSRWEGLPFAILEALAYAKPCLLTEETNISEYVVNAGAGIKTTIRPDEIAENLRIFANMEDTELNEMGKNAKVLVKNEFNWTRIATKIIDAYKSTI